jgi:eukaryotic-like serine/threonine-protein kinase
MHRIRRLVHEVHRRSLWQVLGLYLVGAWIAYQVILALVAGVGLPDWVPAFAVVLFLIGLPIVLATAFVQEGPPRGALPDTGLTGLETAGAVLERRDRPQLHAPRGRERPSVAALLTWNRTLVGGVLAFALLGVTTTGYMTMRALGIGPVASLAAQGILDEYEPLVLGRFEATGQDTLIADALTEAYRVALEQSRMLRPLDRAAVRELLRRSDRSTDAVLDDELARELAQRAGLRAYIAGDLRRVGGTYVLSSRLAASETGETLASFRTATADSLALLDAVESLAKSVRERSGESLRAIRRSPRLQQVTTPSLEALRIYTQAVHAIDAEGNSGKGIALLEQAIALDTAFAMAYRKLAAELGNHNISSARAQDALKRAYAHRDRLTEQERFAVSAFYHRDVEGDRPKAVAAYEALLAIDPHSTPALNNLALLYLEVGDRRRAGELLGRGAQTAAASPFVFSNLAQLHAVQGDAAEARRVIEAGLELYPMHTLLRGVSVLFRYVEGDLAAAEEGLRELRETSRSDPVSFARLTQALGEYASVRGRLREARREFGLARSLLADAGVAGTYLASAAQLARVEAQVARRPAEARRVLDDALRRFPLEDLPAADRPYAALAHAEAAAGRPDRGRAHLEQAGRELDQGRERRTRTERDVALAFVELADGRVAEALEIAARVDGRGTCEPCTLAILALAHDAAGHAEAAIQAYEGYVAIQDVSRIVTDASFLARALERLGELHEARGDRDRAALHYARLLDIWEGADAELQPQIERVRGALDRLVRSAA